ncbi:MAG: alkaline phosphatase family protein [Methanophagales archaeon]|nr:alkaline phosphatase family protein [Methanophagales archaeon]
MPPKNRTVIIGIDGVPFGLLDDLTEKSVMLNFAELRNEGIFRQMRSSIPEISSVSRSSVIIGHFLSKERTCAKKGFILELMQACATATITQSIFIFFMVDTSLTRKGGLGLGLTIVKGYVKLHGGKVWVTSELGKRVKVLVHIA